jgi:hypothetical protein
VTATVQTPSKRHNVGGIAGATFEIAAAEVIFCVLRATAQTGKPTPRALQCEEVAAQSRDPLRQGHADRIGSGIFAMLAS